VLAGVESATPWETVTIDDARLVSLGEDAAAIVYQAHAKRADEEVYRAAITSVYRRDDGDWELALHQQTPLPAS
jgi:hypothetical protein